MKRFLTLGILLAAATAAGSFTYTWSPPAKWGAGAIPGPSGNVVWLMNSAGTPDFAGGPATGDGEVTLIMADLLDWETSTSGALDLEYGGSTAADATYSDGLNVIYWNEAWTGPPGVAGLGGSVVDGTNTIIEGNVELNGTMDWSSSSLIEGINLHELGHALGLGHSAVSGAVMASTFTGTLDPQPDDVSGMVSLYGTGTGGDGVGGGSPPPPPPPPPPSGGGSSSSNDDDDDDDKKRCGLTGLEFPLLAGFWALTRRVRRLGRK
ncbi:MAG: hypothetical protein FD180_2260 [Planctomycetota bacterium]|nr:MAG: hypothetical protein FD180_2260 [Planctomycetota bacterium]